MPLKKLEKSGDILEDEMKQAEEKMQKTTDKYITKVDSRGGCENEGDYDRLGIIMAAGHSERGDCPPN